MRYLAVLCICLGGHILFYMVSAFSPTSPWWYVVQSSFSLLIVHSIIIIHYIRLPFIPLKTWFLFGIIGLESSAILLNIVTVYGGLSPNNLLYWLYYDYILGEINKIEATLLIIGAPWGGIFSRIKTICSPFAARLATSYTSIRYNPLNKIRAQKTW